MMQWTVKRRNKNWTRHERGEKNMEASKEDSEMEAREENKELEASEEDSKLKYLYLQYPQQAFNGSMLNEMYQYIYTILLSTKPVE